MVTDRRKHGYTVVIVAVITMFLSGCRSSPVSPSSGMNLTIKYGVQARSHVTFEVSNSYNTTVATLVDTTEDAGFYTVTWGTAEYPSGLYFYTLTLMPEGGGTKFSITRKFIVE